VAKELTYIIVMGNSVSKTASTNQLPTKNLTLKALRWYSNSSVHKVTWLTIHIYVIGLLTTLLQSHK